MRRGPTGLEANYMTESFLMRNHRITFRSKGCESCAPQQPDLAVTYCLKKLHTLTIATAVKEKTLKVMPMSFIPATRRNII